MDYAEARAAFFQPRAEGTPAPLPLSSSPARALRDAVEPLATVCFWAEPAVARAAEEGLDFLEAYVWGRSSVMGEPVAPLAAAALAAFEPGLVTGLYEAARARAGLEQVRRAREEGVVATLRQVLPDVGTDDVASATAQLRAALAAGDLLGRPLAAGASALPEPADPLAGLWVACTWLREHRGDGHVLACVAAGLDAVQANLLTETAVGWEPLSYTATRGWSPEAMAAGMEDLQRRGLVADGALTADGRRLREDVEATTDRLVQPVVDALGEGLPDLVARLDAWSQAVVDAGWFPPDPYKRASG